MLKTLNRLSMAIMASIILSGCSTSIRSEWMSVDAPRHGDRPYDVCHRCGEDWIFIPNEPHAATRQAFRNQGFVWGNGDAPRY